MTQPTNPHRQRVGDNIKGFLVAVTLSAILFALMTALLKPPMFGLITGNRATWHPNTYYPGGFDFPLPVVTLAVSPREDCIVFTGPGVGQRDLYVLNPNTRHVTCLAKTAQCEKFPSFSPDGRSVIYSASVPGDWADHIFVRSLQTGQGKQLTTDGYFDAMPSFSSDGSRIVFVRAYTYAVGLLSYDQWKDWGACTMKADGLQVQFASWDSDVPTDGYPGNFVGFPRFTPDGRTITRASPLAKLDTRQIREVIFDNRLYGNRKPGEKEFTDEMPVLASNGKRIYFLPFGSSGNPTGLWRIDVDGRNLVQIADGDLFKSPLTWKPKELP